EEAANIWKQLFENANVDPSGRIFYYGVDENWWSRSGEPKDMPAGEPGGPDSEVFFDFYPEQGPIGKDLKIYSHNGRLLEIGNSVFMQYQKQADGSFKELPQKNVDFGGGLERLLAAVENQQDMFQTNLFSPIIQIIEKQTEKDYKSYAQEMRIVTDHLIAATFVSANGVSPSNKEQGYILRRLIRRGLDGFYKLNGKDILPVLESIVEQYKDTDPNLVSLFEKIKYTLLQEEKTYKQTLTQAKKYIIKQSNLEINISEKVKVNEGLKAITKISPDDAFILYTTHGLSPTQIKSLGYEFDEQEFAKKMEEHQALSRKGAEQKFKGGLADTQEKTIMGHTATHLLHQALRDVLGNKVHQTGSNITTERVRFDFNYDQKLTDEQIKEVEKIVNEKIRENLPVHFEMLPLEEAKKIGAIGLFDEKYGDKVKVYFIGGGPSARASTDLSRMSSRRPYSAEFCGGPHVDFTQRLKRFKIIKQENIGHGQRRIYAKVND
ncbi:MAG: alanine--tRNA ligase, partial [Candidatus Levybacteria bacterium]|nr:alanine--tRNA ligase [Candidatus Levybacteria bacterium]